MHNTSLEYAKVIFIQLIELLHGVVYPLSEEGNICVDPSIAWLSTSDAPTDQAGQLIVVLSVRVKVFLLAVVTLVIVLVLSKDVVQVFTDVVNEGFPRPELLRK